MAGSRRMDAAPKLAYFSPPKTGWTKKIWSGNVVGELVQHLADISEIYRDCSYDAALRYTALKIKPVRRPVESFIEKVKYGQPGVASLPRKVIFQV